MHFGNNVAASSPLLVWIEIIDMNSLVLQSGHAGNLFFTSAAKFNSWGLTTFKNNSFDLEVDDFLLIDFVLADICEIYDVIKEGKCLLKSVVKLINNDFLEQHRL